LTVVEETMSKKKKYKKGTEFHRKRLGGQRGGIPGAVRITGKPRLNYGEGQSWVYNTTGTGRCGICTLRFKIGDMEHATKKPRQHYRCP